MKITIDTKEDSHEEIRRAIRMLSSLVGEKEVMTNQSDVFSDENSEAQDQNMFNMFNNPQTENKTEEPKKEETENVDLDIPSVEEYDD